MFYHIDFRLFPQLIILNSNPILQTALIFTALQLQFFSKFCDFNNLIEPALPKVVFVAHLGVMVPELETEMSRSRKLWNCSLDCIF